MSELDLAKKLFGTSNRNTGYSSAPSRIQNQGVTTTVGTSSTRYGTVQAIGDNNYLTILLDGSDEPIKAYCETPVVVGQRVSVVIGNNTITVIALQSFVEQVQQNQEQTNTKFQEIQQQGEELAASVAEDIQQVQDSADAASSKADELSSSLGELSGKVDSVETTVNGVESDVSELTTTVTATQETAQSALTAATSAQQDITGFKTTVSQTYETKADADAAMAQEVLDRNSAIEQSATQINQSVSQNYQSKTDAGTMQSTLQAQIKTQADRITQEVSDRKTAVSGAIEESKAYTDTTAESITSTVIETVDDAMGQTYATKSEVQQTADGLNLNISSALTAANNAQADVNGLSDVVSDNSETVANVNAYFQFGSDAEGNPLLTLGSSESEMKSEYSNKALSFKSNGNEVMRLDGSTSTVTANKMQMGNYQWNGEGDTLRLIYVGGE